MEIENLVQQNGLSETISSPISTPILEPSSEFIAPRSENSLVAKAKTALRLKYEAEAQMILKKLGGLEGIRLELGLSQRKICQLLLVDPSSWSRWLQDQAKTPPHILRALEWHMALMDKYPGFDINFWLHSSAKSTSLAYERSQKLEADLLAQTLELKKRIQYLETQIEMLSHSHHQTHQANHLANHLAKDLASSENFLDASPAISGERFFGLKKSRLRILYLLLAGAFLFALKRLGLF